MVGSCFDNRIRPLIVEPTERALHYEAVEVAPFAFPKKWGNLHTVAPTSIGFAFVFESPTDGTFRVAQGTVAGIAADVQALTNPKGWTNYLMTLHVVVSAVALPARSVAIASIV